MKPVEKTGLESILNNLEDLDLFNLCDTVTKRMLRASNRQDAINSILSCIENPCDLLKRQKITRKVLLSYLHGLNKPVSAETSKVNLILKCLEEWKCDDKLEEVDYMEMSEEVDSGQNDLMTMAVEFTRWFFPLYNYLKDFDTKHFWEDVRLQAEMVSQLENKSFDIVGDKDVVQFLSSLIINQKLFFHPNDSTSSLSSELEQHGMVKIMVSGILHQLNNAIGIFDSAFGLVRNPAFENNWKIKWVFIQAKGNIVYQIQLPGHNQFAISH